MEDGIHDECDLYLYQFSEQGYWNSPYNTVLDLYYDMAVQRNQLYFRYCYNWAIFVEFCLER